MLLSSEFFVMIIFIAGAPFFYLMLRHSGLPGDNFFIMAFVFLTFSNIFTVAEEFCLTSIFNTSEHIFTFLGSCTMLIAIIKLMNNHHSDNMHRISDDLKG